MDLWVMLLIVILHLAFGVILSMLYVRKGLQDVAAGNAKSLYAKLFTRKDEIGRYAPSGYGMILAVLLWMILAIILAIYNCVNNPYE